jgi:O-antigen/teichoic acid export membrane protein
MDKSEIQAGRHMMVGTAKIFLAEALIIPTGFITAVFLSRSLGPAFYGLFALVSRLILWIEWSSTAGYSDTTLKLVGEAPDWKPIGVAVLRLHVFIGIALGILAWLLSSFIAEVFNEPLMADYIKLFSIEIPISSMLTANINILVGRGFFKERAGISAIRWISRLGLIVLLVCLGFSVKGAIIGSIGATVAALLISTYHIRPSLFFKKSSPILPLLKFSAPLFLSSLSIRIFRLDLFALKFLGGTAAHAGFYGAAMNMATLPAIFSSSLVSPLISTLSRLLSKQEITEAKEIALTAIRTSFWMAPLAAMTAGASGEIVTFVFGRAYLPAGRILAYLVFAAIGLNALYISTAIFTALGKPRWAFILAGPMVPLALIGHLFLTVKIGGVGAAMTTTLVAASGGLVSIWAVYNTWKILPPAKSVFSSILCSILAYSLAAFWVTTGWLLLVKLLGITLTVLIAFRLLKELSAQEIAVVRSIFPKRY